MDGKGRHLVQSVSTSQGCSPQTRETSQSYSFSPRSEGSKPHIGLPSLGVLHQEVEHPEYLALKARETYDQESQRSIGNRDSVLKGHAQNLTCSEFQHRDSSLKGACSDPLADVGELPREREGPIETPPGDRETGGSQF